MPRTRDPDQWDVMVTSADCPAEIEEARGMVRTEHTLIQDVRQQAGNVESSASPVRQGRIGQIPTTRSKRDVRRASLKTKNSGQNVTSHRLHTCPSWLEELHFQQ